MFQLWKLSIASNFYFISIILFSYLEKWEISTSEQFFFRWKYRWKSTNLAQYVQGFRWSLIECTWFPFWICLFWRYFPQIPGTFLYKTSYYCYYYCYYYYYVQWNISKSIFASEAPLKCIRIGFHLKSVRLLKFALFFREISCFSILFLFLPFDRTLPAPSILSWQNYSRKLTLCVWLLS